LDVVGDISSWCDGGKLAVTFAAGLEQELALVDLKVGGDDKLCVYCMAAARLAYVVALLGIHAQLEILTVGDAADVDLVG